MNYINHKDGDPRNNAIGNLELRPSPATEYQLTLTKREMASIQAGLRLLQYSAGAGNILPYGVCRMVDDISAGNGAVEPLTDAEIAELVRRLA